MRDKISLWQKIALVAFGLLLTAVLLEVGLRLGGFAVVSLQEYRNLNSIRHKGAYRIMCLGESTTQGQYPFLLEKILNQRGIGVRFSVIDKGLGSIKTSGILAQLESNLAAYHPDMVVAMMGINDEGAHIPHEVVSTSRIAIFLKSFHSYKLAKVLRLHIITKAREAGLYKPSEEEQRSEKIQYYKRAIELGPENSDAYFKLGRLYLIQGKFSQAEAYLKKAVELNPKNDAAQFGIGQVYRNQGKLLQAEEYFKKAVELNPKNSVAYFGLGQIYQSQGKFSQAEGIFGRVIELNPRDDRAYMCLGSLYQAQGRLFQANEAFRKGLELNPRNDCAYGALSVLYEATGNPAQAKAHAQKAHRIRLGEWNSVTVDNYRKLKEILDQKGIRLVCVQYPMRGIEPLKNIFQGKEDSIVFIDNTSIFRDAVKKDGYNTYFNDMFGGDFGHCTEKGNRLLAENIANTILKEVFYK